MGSKSFVIHCILSHNRYRVETTALANTGVNAFALVDTKCVAKLVEFLNVPIEPLPKPVLVKDYNGYRGNSITSILYTHL